MRPSRAQLIRKFFPGLGETGTGGETDAAIEINTRSCELVLVDLIEVFDKNLKEKGPGVLCLNLISAQATHYVPLATFCEDLLDAERDGDKETSGFLKQLIAKVRLHNFDNAILVLLADNSCQSLLAVPREYPADAIRRLQKEATI